MNLFLISNMYPSLQYPEYGVFVKNFKEKIIKNGGVFVCESVIRGKSLGFYRKLRAYIKYYISIFKNYRKEKFDIIYIHYLSHNAPIMVLLLLIFYKKSSIVVNVHGSDVVKQNKNIFKIFNNYLLKRVDSIVVPSAYFKDVVVQNFPFFNKDKIIIYPSGGIDLNVFYNQGKNRKKEFTIGFVSRINKGKGWSDFIEALAILKAKEIKFNGVIVGSGKDEDLMKELIIEHNLSKEISHIDAVDQNKLGEIYNSFDLFVFSTKMLESLGLVGLEALACGVPVIAPDIAGPKTYLENNVNGFLYKPNEVMGIVECILRYLFFSDLEKDYMVRKAIATANEYESEFVSRKLYDELQKL